MGVLKRFRALVGHVLVLMVTDGVPKRSCFIALLVGTTLTLINQGTVIIAGGIPPWWKVLLTYIVPYLVSTYGAVSAMLRAEEDANDIEETATGEENAEVKVEVSIQDGAIPVLERWNPPATCQSPQGKWIKSTFLKNYEGAEGNTIPAVDTKLAQVNIKE